MVQPNTASINNCFKKINKSGLFSCPYRILDYFSDILFTFLTTLVLITKPAESKTGRHPGKAPS